MQQKQTYNDPAHIEKKNIFLNLINGVEVAQIAKDFKKTDKEIIEIREFVIDKIKAYVFQQGLPYVKCSTIPEIKKNIKMIAYVLERVNLAKPPKFKVITKDFNNPNMLLGGGKV